MTQWEEVVEQTVQAALDKGHTWAFSASHGTVEVTPDVGPRRTILIAVTGYVSVIIDGEQHLLYRNDNIGLTIVRLIETIIR